MIVTNIRIQMDPEFIVGGSIMNILEVVVGYKGRQWISFLQFTFF